MIFNNIKFIWIALCFLTALASRLRCADNRDWAFLTLGMGFTLTADYFLILHDRQIIGTFVFCFAHASYILRTGGINKIWLLLAPAALFAGIYGANLLLAASFAYAVLFIMDIISHIDFYKKNTRLPKPNRILALMGILLFALCDINVLLYNLPRFIPAAKPVSEAAFILLWIFYIPSQAVLALSAIDPRVLHALFPRSRK